MVDADAEEVLARPPLHILEDGDDVARSNVSAAQAGGSMKDLGDLVDLLQSVLAEVSVAKRGLDLASQVIAGRREGIVHPFDDGNCLCVVRVGDDLLCWEGAEGANTHAARCDSLLLAKVIDRRLSRLEVRSHADQDVFGVLAAIRHHEVIPAARLHGELAKGFLERRFHPVVIPALGDLAFHIRVLVLHDARHHRVVRVHEVQEFFRRRADVLLHEFWFAETDRLDGVRRQEAVLDVQEGGVGVFGGSAGDQAEVARFLGIAGEEDAPAAVGNGHHVVMAGVDVEAVAGEGSSPNVEDDRQPFTGDGVKHLLHQDESLSGGEVRDAAARQRKTLAKGCRRVLAFRLEEHQLFPP